MDTNKTKEVVIFIAPPGAGKGTQTNIIEDKLGYTHIESSKVIEGKFNDGDQKDPRIIEAREQWHSGELVNPESVTMWMTEKMKEVFKRGESIILSGSPRTLYEAEEEVPLLEELYGKDNIKVFHITLPEEESIRRNSKRRICKAERHPIPDIPRYKDIDGCPWDGSEVTTRALDNPEVIKERLKEYKNRTEPVIKYMIDRGYSIIEINGNESIESVSHEILKYFNHDTD
ncbi:MAG: nucleoside monophosphate kinase [Parcubacteria group bacterium]